MKEVTDIKEYCKDCANARTPICDSCRHVEYNGVITKGPTQFVGIDFSDTKVIRMRLSDLRALINDRVKNAEFIPVRWVLEYNKLIESELKVFLYDIQDEEN